MLTDGTGKAPLVSETRGPAVRIKACLFAGYPSLMESTGDQPNGETSQVKQAYRKALLLWHPDKPGPQQPQVGNVPNGPETDVPSVQLFFFFFLPRVFVWWCHPLCQVSERCPYVALRHLWSIEM